LSKFADSEYEKVDRLLEIRESAVARLKITEREIAAARAEVMAEGDGEGDGEDDIEMWYLRRLDGGLFTLQTVDYILGWICMEDDGVSHATILMVFDFLPVVSRYGLTQSSC
jgi:beta-catenin-like protein 1